MIDKQFLIGEGRLALSEVQVGFYARYEALIATFVFHGYSEEESTEMANTAVELNQKLLDKSYKKHGGKEMIIDSSIKLREELLKGGIL